MSITIENQSREPKTYTLSYIGAGYSDYYLQYTEPSQQPLYGTATFPTPTITIGAGQSTKVSFFISPPSDARPSSLPVFGSFITVTDPDQSAFSIPYVQYYRICSRLTEVYHQNSPTLQALNFFCTYLLIITFNALVDSK